MKIVRTRLNEIRRGGNAHSSMGVGKTAHLREFYDLISNWTFLKLSAKSSDGWSKSNDILADALDCNVNELRFTSFYYDDLWGRMKDWFGDYDFEIEIAHNTGSQKNIARVWQEEKLIVVRFKELFMDGKNYFQIYTTEQNALKIQTEAIIDNTKNLAVNEIKRSGGSPLSALNMGKKARLGQEIASVLVNAGLENAVRTIDHVRDEESMIMVELISSVFSVGKSDVMAIDDSNIEIHELERVAADLVKIMKSNESDYAIEKRQYSDSKSSVSGEIETEKEITCNEFVAVLKETQYTVSRMTSRRTRSDFMTYIFINPSLVKLDEQIQ